MVPYIHRSLFTYIRLFSHLQVSFEIYSTMKDLWYSRAAKKFKIYTHTCTSLFICTLLRVCLFWIYKFFCILTVSAFLTFTLIRALIHVHYIWMYVSFHMCTLHIHVPRISYLNVSSHTYTSLFVHEHLFSYMHITYECTSLLKCVPCICMYQEFHI